MTLEEAIKRVASVEWVDPADGEMQEAFALVLAEAKRPRVYALGEEEREALGDMLADLQRAVEEFYTTQPRTDRQQRMAALIAALALEQPSPLLQLNADGSVTELKAEEPFTVAELETLETALGLCMAEWDKSPGDEPLAAKLRAYIEKKATDRRQTESPRPIGG